jgi:hypothetical protein
MPILWEMMDVTQQMEALEQQLIAMFDPHPITGEPDMSFGWVVPGASYGPWIRRSPAMMKFLGTDEVLEKNDQWDGVRESAKWKEIHAELIPLRKRYNVLLGQMYEDEEGLILRGRD